MDRLYQERMARLVLDRLLDSGELRSVASERALAMRMHYLPQRIRLDVPAEDDFLPLLDPNRRERAAAGLREAILRVVTHEEGQHWVVLGPELELDVHLRERSRLAKVRPVYELGEELAAPEGTRLGEPRLRLTWQEQTFLFRERQGLARVELGRRMPGLVILEAGPGDDALAWLYCTGPVDIQTATGVHRVRARTRIPVSHDLSFVARPPWTRPWLRRVQIDVEVLGLARQGRPALQFAGSDGRTRTWARNLEPRLELVPDVTLHAGELDEVVVDNSSAVALELTWFDGRALTVPGGSRVAVQGGHLLGIRPSGGTLWAVSIPGAAHVPPPRVVRLEAAVPARRRDAQPEGHDEPTLFRYEQRAARILQDAVVLRHVEGATATVAVKDRRHEGPLAEVALDDCAGAKVRLLRDADGEPVDEADAGWRSVGDVLTLYPTGARLEVVGTAQVTFETPRVVGQLTTDPSDAFVAGGWRLGLRSDGLVVEGGGPAPADVDGTTLHGPSRLPWQDSYRVRAGDGVFRIVRAGPSER